MDKESVFEFDHFSGCDEHLKWWTNGTRGQAKQHTDSREIRVKIPGIDPEKIEVEVNENRVCDILYNEYCIPAARRLRMPYSVYNRQQPYFIDVSKIVAQVEEEELVVTLAV